MIKKNFSVIAVIAVFVIVAVASVFLFYGKKGEKVAGEYDTFAQCLYESGMRMYGSATCNFCRQQRKMFGPSFEFVREIECDPRNPNPETERCIDKNISHTPTWIHEDANGDELFRFKSGVVSFEDLAERSGCPLIKDSIEAGS